MATKVIEKITKKNQGELQGKINSSYNSDNPSKYYASYIETEDGKVCLVAKPLKIEKNFCFAEGRTRDISEAIELAEKAKRDRDHFISKNVQRAGYEEKIEKIKKVKNGDMQAFFYTPTDCKDGKGEVGIWFEENWKIGEDGLPSHKFISPSSFREVTDEELQAYKQAVLTAKDSLLKRLNTYLKRFGLSKVRTWTYWDEA